MTIIATAGVRGRQHVSGWLVRTSVYGEDGARRRIAQLATSASVIYRVDEGYWLVLPEPVSVCEPFPAEPVLNTVSGPSTLATRPPGGSSTSLWLVREGQGVRAEATVVDPSRWVQLEATPAVVQTLGRPPGIEATPFEERRTARADFKVMPASEQMMTVHDALVESVSGSASASREPTSSAQGQPVGTTAMRWVARNMMRLLRRLPAPAPDSRWSRWRPSWLRRLESWLDRLAMPRLLAKHEAYLQGLVDAFRQEDLDEALRRAIPLGYRGLRPGQGRLARDIGGRNNTLSPGANSDTGDGTRLMGSSETFYALRQHYTRAKDALIARGEIEKASFVLVDLLNQARAGMYLCEQHDHMTLGATIAEAHVPVPEAVGWWLRAGDVARAVSLAERTQCWAEAVAVAERHFKHSVRPLRALWAAQLVRGGEWLAAIEVVAVDAELYPSARPWIDKLIANGGLSAAIARVHRLALDGDVADAERLVAWARTAQREERLHLLPHLVRLDGCSQVAQQAYRAVYRSALPDLHPVENRAHSSRRCLADVRLDAVVQYTSRSMESTVIGDGPVTGADVVPGGMVLVSTPTELRLYDADGGERARHTLYSPSIVAPARGAVALIVVPIDGSTIAVYRLDTLSGALSLWAQLHVPVAHGGECWDDKHDGRWWVALPDRVIALDVSDPEASALVTLRGGEPDTLLRVTPTRVVAACGDEVLSWAAPKWRLYDRAATNEWLRRTVGESEAEQRSVTTAAFSKAWRCEWEDGRVVVWCGDELRTQITVHAPSDG